MNLLGTEPNPRHGLGAGASGPSHKLVLPVESSLEVGEASLAFLLAGTALRDEVWVALFNAISHSSLSLCPPRATGFDIVLLPILLLSVGLLGR